MIEYLTKYVIIINNKKKEGMVKMNKNKKGQYNKSQILVKIMASILVVLMLAGTAFTIVYALIG